MSKECLQCMCTDHLCMGMALPSLSVQLPPIGVALPSMGVTITLHGRYIYTCMGVLKHPRCLSTPQGELGVYMTERP